MSPVSAFNLALRGLMEFGVVAGFAYWGVHTGDTTGAKVLLGVLSPAVAFGIWGAIDFRFAGRHAELFRLIEELLISGLAGAALYGAGQQALGLILVGISLLHHALVYVLGERLLKPPPTAG